MFRVVISGKQSSQVYYVENENETNLLDFLRNNGFAVESPCGGNGTCGKCKVLVSNSACMGCAEAYEEVLACQTIINNDMIVLVDSKDNLAKAQIMTDSFYNFKDFRPYITKKKLFLPNPDIKDQRADAERILDEIRKSDNNVIFADNLEQFRELPYKIRQNNYEIECILAGNKIINVQNSGQSSNIYGIAFDIGTTTIAAYLYDLSSGQRVDVISRLNPQRKFGADVISRIGHTMQGQDKRLEMHNCIKECVNSIVEEFCSRNGIKEEDVYHFVFAGNTTMCHFLCDIFAGHIASAPFIPAVSVFPEFRASETGFLGNKCAPVTVLPCVSAYIGADTIAAVISSGMADDHASLLIDIGTNGEIVLLAKNSMYACSTAAGPAFEGANITFGIGGIEGAINKVYFDTDIRWTSINNAKPVGICGSGIIDAVNVMLKIGIIDETGRIIDEDENSNLSTPIKRRIINSEEGRAFIIAYEHETSIHKDIIISQKDIREVQNAKAAIAAGIQVLAIKAGIHVGEINNVYLAGGFGSYINIDSAIGIGLLPKQLKGRIRSIGNAAGAGACAVLADYSKLSEAIKLSKTIKYIELSSSSEFVNLYVENMMFEDMGG